MAIELHVSILGLTETWLCPSELAVVKMKFKGWKVFESSVEEKKDAQGKGIVAFVRYPLAQNVIFVRKIKGRMLNLVLRGKKKKEISIYILQAPSGPLGEGKVPTQDFSDKLREYIEVDIDKRRSIVLGGDINSYLDRNMDYEGTAGQGNSFLIETLCE